MSESVCQTEALKSNVISVERRHHIVEPMRPPKWPRRHCFADHQRPEAKTVDVSPLQLWVSYINYSIHIIYFILNDNMILCQYYIDYNIYYSIIISILYMKYKIYI